MDRGDAFRAQVAVKGVVVEVGEDPHREALGERRMCGPVLARGEQDQRAQQLERACCSITCHGASGKYDMSVTTLCRIPLIVLVMGGSEPQSPIDSAASTAASGETDRTRGMVSVVIAT